MKKHRKIDAEPIDGLSDFLYWEIESGYRKSKTNSTFKNYGKFFGKRPKSNNECREVGCRETPIYSHSISKNAVLKNISNNGKVYTPTVTKDSIVMKPVGIETEASVFPFYCNKHDTNLFSELDKTDWSPYSSKFFEQLIHRTICREFYVHERSINMTHVMIDEIEAGFRTVKNHTINQINEMFNSKRIKIEDWKNSRFSLTEDKKYLEDKLNFQKSRYAKLIDLYSRDRFDQITAAIVDTTLPVAFSGLASFQVIDQDVFLVINCLPYKDCTVFSIATTARDAKLFQREILSEYDLDKEDSLLKFIETLAINGTDNIFFDIEFWNSLDCKIIDRFINDFSNFSGSDLRNSTSYSFLRWGYK